VKRKLPDQEWPRREPNLDGEKEPDKGRFAITRRTLVARAGIALGVLLLVPSPSPAAQGEIHSFAGGVGDNGAAVQARLFSPSGFAVDSNGNIFIADTANNRIRQVDPSGTITTVAGTGAKGFAGDGLPATRASLSAPQGVAVDIAGNLYVADTGNNRIRKVSTGGVITTFAGSGSGGFSGDGSIATRARINQPSGLSLDANNNLYIADTANNRIRVVNAASVISTVAGKGTRGFSGDRDAAKAAQLAAPKSAWPDAAGNIYIADTGNNRIRKVDPTGVITTVAGTGLRGFAGDGLRASHSRLSSPSGVAIDAAGNIIVADTGNNRIRSVDLAGTITTLAGTGLRGYLGDDGAASRARFSRPSNVFATADAIYVSDTGNNRIRKIDPSGLVTLVAGSGADGFSGDGGVATSARLSTPTGAVLDAAGNLYVADTNDDRVRKINADGIISTVAGNGVRGFSGDGGRATRARLNAPRSVALDSRGNLYIADTGNNRVRRVTRSGIISTVAGTGALGFSGDKGPARRAKLAYPAGITVDRAGNLYIADAVNYRVRKVNRSGIITTIAGTGVRAFGGDNGPATAARFNLPSSVVVDPAGNIFIADTSNQRIRVISGGGTIRTIAGGQRGFLGDGGPASLSRLNTPLAMTLDEFGNLYFADAGNGRIRVIYAAANPDATIDTVAGNGAPATVPTTDGVPARATNLVAPAGVAVSPDGLLYIVDAGDNRIRLVEL
jgi:sugar lactone lactonase YvrE